METQHFTARKVSTGWEIYRGLPDEVRTLASKYYLAHRTHSNDVFDYCTELAGSYNDTAQLHFDLREI